MRVPLHRVAHVRSGDKGNTALIGVFAYSPDLYVPLSEQLTAERVAETYGKAVTGVVKRFDIPAIDAMNFTLDGALGGGVSRSLALDNFGKALCSRLLAVEIDVPPGLENQLRAR
jgi:hypothetical protein